MRRASSLRRARAHSQPRLGAGARLALVGHGGLRGAQRLGGLAMGGFGCGERVGGGLRGSLLRLGQLAHELLALLLDHGAAIRQGLAISGLGLGDALLRAWRSAGRRRPSACASARARAAMAACRSVRARCSRSSVMSSVLASVTRERSSWLLSAPRPARPPAFRAAERAAPRSRFRKAGRAPRPAPPACALWRRRRRRSWLLFRAPAAPWRSARRASARAWLWHRAKAGAGGAPRPGPRAAARRPPRPRPRAASAARRAPASCAASAPSRLRSASRAGGGSRHLRGGDEAVPAPQIALARDQTLARLEQPLQARRRRRASTTPIWLQAARQLGRRRDVGASGSTPAGSAGSGSAAAFSANARAPLVRPAHRGRRPAPRRAPSRSRPPP